MARLVSAVGELSYNGVTFPGPIRAHIEATPVYDSIDRGVKYVQYKLMVETIFSNDDHALVGLWPTVNAHTNDICELVRARLSEPRKILRIREKGFGLDVIVNGSSTGTAAVVGLRANKAVMDLNHGPKTRLLGWQPVGDNRSFRATWEVEFCITECGKPQQLRGLSTSLGGSVPLEKVYTVDFSINERGLTVRTIDGQIVMPKIEWTIWGASSPGLNADDYRYLITFPIPPGFVRSQKYSLSEDRSTLKFTLTDRELPSDYHFTPGTLTMEANHSIRSKFLDGQEGGFVKWDCSIDAKITLPKSVTKPGSGFRPASLWGTPVTPGFKYPGRKMAWLAFQEILSAKIFTNIHDPATGHPDPGSIVMPKSFWGEAGKVKASHYKSTGHETLMKEGNAAFIPIAISGKETLYDRVFNFTFDYWLFCMPDWILDCSKFLHSDGPGTGLGTGAFKKYIDVVGGRDKARSRDARLEPFSTKEFDSRGVAGPEATTWGSDQLGVVLGTLSGIILIVTLQSPLGQRHCIHLLVVQFVDYESQNPHQFLGLPPPTQEQEQQEVLDQLEQRGPLVYDQEGILQDYRPLSY